MDLKVNKNGQVEFIMRAGKDFVAGTLSEQAVQTIMKNGKVTESDQFKNYPIAVDDTYFFAAKPKPAPKPVKEEKKG